MIDLKEFRELIVVPTLKDLNLWSQPAENLLIGTALTESGLTYLKQSGGGPAIGFFQCEPLTHSSVTDYIKRHPEKANAALRACGFSDWPSVDALMWNLRYATMICRYHYYRFPEPIPSDPDGLYQLYKLRYNGPGAANYDKCIEAFKTACKE